MFILAVENKGIVYAYNEQKQQCLNVSGELKGYTCKTVAVQRGENIYIYDLDGQEIAQYPNDFFYFFNIIGVIL